MNKPVVFISHVTEENEVASAFKDLVESSFLNMLEVFVSSDPNSVAMGQKWLTAITEGLRTCAVEVIVVSPKSVRRPWIQFEAGAGWIRDVPVIPLCHSGSRPSELPVPLNLLQGAVATDVSQLKLVFPVLASAIGCATPKVDFSDFISSVIEFEKKYTFWDECNSAFALINKVDSRIVPALRQGKNVSIQLNETQITAIQTIITFLSKHQLLAFHRGGDVHMKTTGMFYDCQLRPLSNLEAVMNDPKFIS